MGVVVVAVVVVVVVVWVVVGGAAVGSESHVNSQSGKVGSGWGCTG